MLCLLSHSPAPGNVCFPPSRFFPFSSQVPNKAIIASFPLGVVRLACGWKPVLLLGLPREYLTWLPLVPTSGGGGGGGEGRAAITAKGWDPGYCVEGLCSAATLALHFLFVLVF